METIEEQFEFFCKQYPRKDDKQRAFQAFRLALSGRKGSKTRLPSPPATFSEIVLGLAQYPFSENPQFIPMAATWLNNRRWVIEQVSRPMTVFTPPSRSSWRDKYDKPEPADWQPAAARQPVTIQGEIFGDD